MKVEKIQFWKSTIFHFVLILNVPLVVRLVFLPLMMALFFVRIFEIQHLFHTFFSLSIYYSLYLWEPLTLAKFLFLFVFVHSLKFQLSCVMIKQLNSIDLISCLSVVYVGNYSFCFCNIESIDIRNQPS